MVKLLLRAHTTRRWPAFPTPAWRPRVVVEASVSSVLLLPSQCFALTLSLPLPLPQAQRPRVVVDASVSSVSSSVDANSGALTVSDDSSRLAQVAPLSFTSSQRLNTEAMLQVGEGEQ